MGTVEAMHIGPGCRVQPFSDRVSAATEPQSILCAESVQVFCTLNLLNVLKQVTETIVMESWRNLLASP